MIRSCWLVVGLTLVVMACGASGALRSKASSQQDGVHYRLYSQPGFVGTGCDVGSQITGWSDLAEQDSVQLADFLEGQCAIVVPSNVRTYRKVRTQTDACGIEYWQGRYQGRKLTIIDRRNSECLAEFPSVVELREELADGTKVRLYSNP